MKNEMKRFYNGETKQLHRFIPLFEKIEDGKVMGICMDSDKKNSLRNGSYNPNDKSLYGWIPKIRKGQMVLVDKPTDGRLGLNYKGDKVFILHKVYNNHSSNDYLGQLWFDGYNEGWKDYKEVN